ncbi:MAG: spore coat protein [Nocardioidaceae bacterium]|nr:spore coat protein [Nocardioidaceae bacterium]NUS51534.1 spore coat protein [Nocardioidaceae bacterium]
MSRVPPTSHAGPVLVSCDVGPSSGVGHLMRCLALAEELQHRGLPVVFAADAGSVPWAAARLEERSLECRPAATTPDEHLGLLRDLDPWLVVLDSYRLPGSVYDAVRAAGHPLLALVDDGLSGRSADVYLDQNLGAERVDVPVPDGAVRLAGLDYALMRDDVVAARGATRPPRDPSAAPRVLAFFGGTDPFGAAPVVADLLGRSGRRFDATFVCTGEAAARVGAVDVSEGQRIAVIAPTPRISEHVLAADVVLSAAGSSVWELMCVGAAVGVVCAADNQEPGYEAVTAADAAVGLGHLEDLASGAAEGIGRLLDDERLRERLRTRARSMVDGRGRTRVVDEVLRRFAGPATLL